MNSASPETLSPKARLRLLKAQYSTLVSKYGDKHPDVVRLRRQIDAMSGSASGGEPAANLDDLEAQLQIASQKYGDAHPDVVRLKRQIKAVKAGLAGNQPAVEAPDNPVYVQTQAQLSAANAEVGMAQAQIAALQGKMADVEARIIKSPEVERAYVRPEAGLRCRGREVFRPSAAREPGGTGQESRDRADGRALVADRAAAASHVARLAEPAGDHFGGHLSLLCRAR